MAVPLVTGNDQGVARGLYFSGGLGSFKTESAESIRFQALQSSNTVQGRSSARRLARSWFSECWMAREQGITVGRFTSFGGRVFQGYLPVGYPNTNVQVVAGTGSVVQVTNGDEAGVFQGIASNTIMGRPSPSDTDFAALVKDIPSSRIIMLAIQPKALQSDFTLQASVSKGAQVATDSITINSGYDVDPSLANFKGQWKAIPGSLHPFFRCLRTSLVTRVSEV